MKFTDSSKFLLPPPAPATEESRLEDELLSAANLRVDPEPALDEADTFPPILNDESLVLKALQGTLSGQSVSSHGPRGKTEHGTTNPPKINEVQTEEASDKSPKPDEQDSAKITSSASKATVQPESEPDDLSLDMPPERTFTIDTRGTIEEVPRKKSLREKWWSIRTRFINSK